MAQDKLDAILFAYQQWIGDGFGPDLRLPGKRMTHDAAKAALLALMYQETLAVIGSNEVEYSNLDGNAGYWEKHGRNGLREKQRQVAVKRFGQEGKV